MTSQPVLDKDLDAPPADTLKGVTERRRRRFQFFRSVIETRLVLPSMIFIGCVIVAAVFAGLLAPYDPNVQDYSVVMEPPSMNFPFGTDHLGRDVLSRVIFGARVSLQVGLVAVGIAVTAGLTAGLIAGYVGGKVDEVIMRVNDALQAFPSLVLALTITAALGPSATNAMIAIGVVSVPVMARLARGQTLTVRETEYVVASRVVGARPVRIIGRHILPNVVAPVIVQATLLIGLAIIIEASLSFLGVGVRPPTATWGGMLRSGQQYLGSAWWLGFAPGVAIFLTVLSINFIGDGLRRALDPRLLDRRQA